MSNPLTDDQLKHLLNFVGYGRKDAEVWFLGMEEGCVVDKELREKHLFIRLKFDEFEDCKEAHKELDITKYHYGTKTCQRTWWRMCRIMLGIEDSEIDIEALRNYQAEKLGQSDGNTLLCELMPIPNRGINEWEYKELLPQYKNRKDYYEKVKPCRIEKLRKLFKEYPPKIVVAYGSTFWKDYEELFKEFRFEKREPFKVAQSENTVILLTPHFVSIQMNGQIEKLVSLIKEKKIIFHLLRNKC